jgi:hypothetical protein
MHNQLLRPRCPLAIGGIALGLAALATFATPARAGCGQFDPGDRAPSFGDPPALSRPGIVQAVFRPGDAELVPVRDDEDAREAGIVGTWRFAFVSDGTAYPMQIPYGALVDFGTVQWHGDGTELMISGARAPSTGDVCMGSWERTGPSTYTLKHIALAWASADSMPPASPPAYLGPAIIREVVKLDRARDRFEGTFTLDQYAKDEVTLLEHISGKVSATRFGAH